MFKALLLLLIIVAGFIVGPLWSGQTGYVMIAVSGYTVETSLVVLAMAVILLLLVFWLIEWLLRKILAGSRLSSSWLQRRRLKKGDTQLSSAFNSWLTHDYAKAQEQAEQATSNLKRPQQAYLLAAMAANARHDSVSYQRLLEKANSAEDDKQLPLLLAEAESAAPKEAQQQLQHLLKQYPRHPGVLRVAAKTFYRHQQWSELRPLLPELAKKNLIEPRLLLSYTQKSYQAYFAVAQEDPTELHKRWRDLDRQLRQDTSVRLEYIRALLDNQQQEEAAKVAIKGLRKGYLEPIDLLLGQSQFDWQGSALLTEHIQQMVKKQPDDANALALLGLLAMQQNDHDLAERALRKALELYPNKRFYQLLGDTYLAAEQSAKALAAYKAASQ
ncbi:heme biosynthesis HemY N-terminal domain-containing protein [Aliidiomarina minuta]|uniref:heme biosynthesis HemY N-terminal domain-containing protein n=1 Tax=Aliidiomarina minuta TaxID=880057 RepID=UPI00130024B4|nr:heme biosynthesis HemY N-terminal domain-containing protein [Aliidiomarina minuta]